MPDPLPPPAREALNKARIDAVARNVNVSDALFAAGMDFQRSEDAHPDLRAGMLARGFIVGRNPDGVDDTVAATLLVLDDLKARAVSVERERDERETSNRRLADILASAVGMLANLPVDAASYTGKVKPCEDELAAVCEALRNGASAGTVDEEWDELDSVRTDLAEAREREKQLLAPLEYLADPENWSGNVLDQESTLYGHDTPYELAVAALSETPDPERALVAFREREVAQAAYLCGWRDRGNPEATGEFDIAAFLAALSETPDPETEEER